MLLVEREASQVTIIDLRRWGLGLIKVVLCDFRREGGKKSARLGFDGDRQIPIDRLEVFEAKEAGKSPERAAWEERNENHR